MSKSISFRIDDELKINAKDRFVFKIEDNNLVVLQVGNHSKDKY